MKMPTKHVSTLQMLLCSTAPGSLSGISDPMVSMFCSERCWLLVKSRTQISRNKFSNGDPAASSLAAAKESLTGNLVSLYLIQATCAAVSNLSTQIFKPLLADQFVPYSNAYRSNSHWRQPEKHWTITGWPVAEPTNKVLMIWGDFCLFRLLAVLQGWMCCSQPSGDWKAFPLLVLRTKDWPDQPHQHWGQSSPVPPRSCITVPSFSSSAALQTFKTFYYGSKLTLGHKCCTLDFTKRSGKKNTIHRYCYRVLPR